MCVHKHTHPLECPVQHRLWERCTAPSPYRLFFPGQYRVYITLCWFVFASFLSVSAAQTEHKSRLAGGKGSVCVCKTEGVRLWHECMIFFCVNSRCCVLICVFACVCVCVCLHEEVLCWGSLRRGGADKPLNVCIVLANELEQNGREYGGGKEKEMEGGRRGTVAIVCSLILLMVLKALAGKQMLFCEMDSIFFPPDLISSEQPGA